jgi:hypothetical protein
LADVTLFDLVIDFLRSFETPIINNAEYGGKPLRNLIPNNKDVETANLKYRILPLLLVGFWTFHPSVRTSLPMMFCT